MVPRQRTDPAASGVGQAAGRTATARACVGYVLAAGAVILVHPLLPADLRTGTYLLVEGSTLGPLGWLVWRLGGADRLPWVLLLAAMTTLTMADTVQGLAGRRHDLASETAVTVGHAILLAAAVALVLRRGRNDIGGLIDVSVAAMGAGGLLWTALLKPQLAGHGATLSHQIALLVSIIVLTGVLGALGRVWAVAERRLPSLHLLVVALMLALIGNTTLAVSTGSMSTSESVWVQVVFMLTYVCVGAAPLHPSVDLLNRPGPAPVDRLSTGRLVFLGAALVATPVTGGMRAMLGMTVDGPLMALGSLIVGSLVMIRVGLLARQRERAEQALLHQATHDNLTGLPNRAELLTRLEAALRRERAARRASVVLLFCDLNGFKEVNDRLGHVVGDQLLAEVGRRIRAGLRAGDTVARYGGDEFVVLCEQPAQQGAVTRLCGHLQNALSVPFEIEGHEVRVSGSVGAVVSDGTTGADELIARADQAMYQAKQRMKGVVA